MSSQRTDVDVAGDEPPPAAVAAGYPTNITKEAVNRLPLATFVGRIHLVNTCAGIEAMMPHLHAADVLGFDTESRPSFRKGENFLPSVVQFATADAAFVVQLPLEGGLNGLIPILECEETPKVGVALRDDVRQLQELQTFSPGAFFDIGTFATALGLETTGLRRLSAILLGRRLSKSAQVSNWARRRLSHKQIVYAAIDAWISRELFLRTRELCERFEIDCCGIFGQSRLT